MAIKEPPLQDGQKQGGARHPADKRIVQRVPIQRKPSQRWLRGIFGDKTRFAGDQPRKLAGYVMAVLSVALATGAVGLVTTFVQVDNLSLVYLLVILWLTVTFGRGPSIMASFLAFLAYDFFFVPPVHHLTVDQPAQWISLLALLATSLVIGQLTATIRTHARKALDSEQRTRRLYGLAQMIASTTDEEQLLQGLVQQVVHVFKAHGIVAAVLILPDANGELLLRATAPADGPATQALSLAEREQTLLAKWALRHSEPIGLNIPGGAEPEQTVFYLPLVSRGHTLGVLGIAGRTEIRDLVIGRNTLAGERNPEASVSRPLSPQAQLCMAFCDQIALALERVLLQQQAIHAEALRESDRLKNILLSSVTHDLRTPLAAIKASTSSLLEPGMTWREGDYLEFVESIDASADRLSHLVSNLLDLSRLESGMVPLEKEWYPMGDVIATVLDRLDAAEQTQDHTIDVELPEDIPLVPLDHGQIESVLTNLIENALKYSPPRSVIRVRARLVGNPPELEVRVSDQGIGIASNELTAIFEKFYRVPHIRLPWASAGPQTTGTGLGLAICANAIRAHQGRIWAESTPGVGSTFIFTLPIPSDPPEGELPELSTSANQSSSPATGAPRE
ncbi:MAG TPA: ATP-binding protein [Ktedonobacterales bacterium]|nr:ATP-binding protein [Ktedonobacterales bacterium]